METREAVQNKDIVRRGYELFAKRDLAGVAELFAPDAVWDFPGTSALSGHHAGRDAIVNDFLVRLVTLGGPDYTAALMDVADGGEHTFTLHISHAERDGQTYQSAEVLVIRIEDGLIRAVHSYPYDASAVETFWR